MKVAAMKKQTMKKILCLSKKQKTKKNKKTYYDNIDGDYDGVDDNIDIYTDDKELSFS